MLTSQTADSSANDQGVHSRGSSTNSRPDFEKEHAHEIQDLGVKLGIHLAPTRNDQYATLDSCEASSAHQTRFVEAAATKNATDSHGNFVIEPKRSTMAG